MPTLIEHRRYIQAALDAAEADGFSIQTTYDGGDDIITIYNDDEYAIVWRG